MNDTGPPSRAHGPSPDLSPLGHERYRLMDVLGRGGMATVFRAFDTRLRVDRAIKVLALDHGKKALVRQRFQNEAHTMARLRHPNIVTVHDVGEEGDRAYMVMELLRGGTLEEKLQRIGPLPARVAASLLTRVLTALQFAHDNNVVHRDVKPGNILLSRRGIPKVTDFGIARVVDGKQQLTRTGAIMGTWAYMAPEQRESARAVDARADVYAAGATLYRLATGREPFEFYAIALDDSRKEQFSEGLPDALGDIILKACAYRAENRYESAAAMCEALEAVLPDLPALGDFELVDPATDEITISGSNPAPETFTEDDISAEQVGPATVERDVPNMSSAETVPSAPYRASRPKEDEGGYGGVVIMGGLIVGLLLVGFVGTLAIGALLWPGEPVLPDPAAPLAGVLTEPEPSKEIQVRPQPEVQVEPQARPRPAPVPQPEVEPVSTVAEVDVQPIRDTGRPPEPEPEPKGGWNVRSAGAGKSTRVTLHLKADKPLHGWPDLVKTPALVLECNKGREAAYVLTDMTAESNEIDLDRATVRIRLDGGAAQTLRMRKDFVDKRLAFPKPRKFVASLEGHGRLWFEMTPWSSPPDSTTFDLSGLDEALVPFRAACGT